MPIRQPRRAGMLLATGQVTSYGSGAGVDDGALQKGIAKAYTILTTGQYSGTTNITINSKTDAHSNNCVVDNNTGLLWSRYASASVGPVSDGKLPWTTTGAGVTAEGIFPYCAAANAAVLAGYSDWRVPNVVELLTLLDTEVPNGVPNTTAFPSWPASNIWSSSTYTAGVANALYTDFDRGIVNNTAKTDTCYIALLRG